MDIDDILLRIRAGDRQAFAEIVRAFQSPLFRFLGNMGLGRGQVEDIAQETFLRAWNNLGQYSPGLSRFSTWLFTIARRLALNEIERAGNRAETLDGNDEVVDLPCQRALPQDALEQARRHEALHRALRRLPAADRSVLALAYLREIDLADIARIEGCTVGAVKTRLHRARNRLSQLLET
ncbi:MAG TPA: sigma-70 family RNA polymerase sigma factor [Parasulfuritortus sp.]